MLLCGLEVLKESRRGATAASRPGRAASWWIDQCSCVGWRSWRKAGGDQGLLSGRRGLPLGGLTSAPVWAGGPVGKQEGIRGWLAAEEGGLLAD